jgi:lipoprotein-anchoring transpeptidase ErfK/SrfK
VRRSLITSAAAALALGAGAAPAAARIARDPAPVVLSGPHHTSYWQFVDRRVVARTAPSRSAKKVATVATRTPEGTANLVLSLARQTVASASWVKVRLGILPNNSTGWVPRSALGGYNTVRTHLFIDTRRLRLRLERAGRTVFRARVGVGKASSPTPAGEFFIRDRLTSLSSFYGPLAFGTSARSAVLTDWPGGGFIGVHGTNEPGLIPGHISHGCVRLRNAEILKLGRRMPVGTPVTIRRGHSAIG